MDMTLSEELREEVDKARTWGREFVRPAGLEADRAGAPLPVGHAFFDRCLESGRGRTAWRRAAESDAPAPEGQTVRRTVVMAELAFWDRGIGVATPGVGLPEGMVLGSATEEQKEQFLGPFRNPDRPRWGSFALTEPQGGSDTAAIRTRARRTDRGWVLNGAKCFIGNAQRADWILIQATTDPDKGRAGQRAFFVPQGTPGLTGMRVEKKMGLRAYESVTFSLEDCEIPLDHILGGERKERQEGGQAYRATMGALNTARVSVAANAAGIARAAFTETLDAARELGLLGDPRVRDRLEEAQRKLRSAWLLVLQSAWLVDQRRGNIVEASTAKLNAAETAQEIAALGLEILGLAGATESYLVEKFFRDAKAMNIVEVTWQIQRIVMARQLVGLPK